MGSPTAPSVLLRRHGVAFDMIDRRSPAPRRAATDRRTEDRRSDNRLPSDARIRFLRAGPSADEVLHGELFDVSASGIRILLPQPLTADEKLLVEVRDAEKHCFNLTAKVVWNKPDPDGQHQVGCELLVDLSERQLELLKELAAAPRSHS